MQRLIKDGYDQRHRVTLPYQCTDELILAMFWLGPENHGADPFAPVLRHLQTGVPVKTRVLPGMQFFDAWRIVSTMSIDPLDDDDLESFAGELPPREKWELKAQSVDRTDAQLLREQHLQARAQNKSSAQMAAEIAQIHLLTTLLADRAELLSDLACAKQGHMDNVKTRTSAKADRKELKRRAGGPLLAVTTLLQFKRLEGRY